MENKPKEKPEVEPVPPQPVKIPAPPEIDPVPERREPPTPFPETEPMPSPEILPPQT